jgi:hypothetical protein
LIAAAFLLLTVAAGVPQTPTVTRAAVALPDALSPAVAGALAPEVTTVTVGSARLEFWLVEALELSGSPASGAPAWSNVPEGALVGALRVGGGWKDIRGFPLREGVYTLRFARQPQNGDHMGISPHREFLLPAPAAEDVSTGPAGHEGAVALAKKASRRAHPASLSLDPPVAAGTPGTTTTSELGHQVVILQVPTTHEGSPTGGLTFGIVVQGTIEH